MGIKSLQDKLLLGSIATGELHHKPKLYKYHTAACVFAKRKEARKKKFFKSKSSKHWRHFSDFDLSLLIVPSSAGEAAVEYREMYFPLIIHGAY